MSLFLLLFLSFLLTFVATRTITRMIRAGVGPFRNNVAGGVHIHHAVPGVILTLIGAYLSVGVAGRGPAEYVAAALIGVGSSLILVMVSGVTMVTLAVDGGVPEFTGAAIVFGMGAALVLDEFALILHLQDVYWSPEGQLSVQLVALVLSGMGLVLLGVNPLTSDAGFGARHAVVLVVSALHVAAILVCVRKGKYSTAALGAFLPPIAWIGAVRLARPGSTWSRRYDPAKQAAARARAGGFDARFGHWGLTIADLIAGRPSLPNPVPGAGPPPAPRRDPGSDAGPPPAPPAGPRE